MAHTADILDERERMAGPAFWSVCLHVSVVALAVGYGVYINQMGPKFGDEHPSAGVYAVTAVDKIPLPNPKAPPNPVANDSQSVAQTVPDKQNVEKREPLPDKTAIDIPDRTPPRKLAEQPRRREQYTPPAPQNVIPSHVPQQAVSPLYGGNTGSGGVGIGPNSPLGERFGWYAELVRRKLAQNWQTNGLAGRQGAPAVVAFTILRDGRVDNVRLEQSSGNLMIDNTALRAVYLSNPLPALPAQYDRGQAPAEFTFDLR